jgi:putative FmdB family regulatory protein
MPTYEYRCPKGHRFDVFQKMSDDPVAECPECGAPAERLISGGAGFLFKGDGFYITETRSEDYRKKASKESSPADGGSSSGDGGGGASGADTSGSKPSAPSTGDS